MAQIIVPLMVTVFFAKLVGDALSYSIYDTHIKIRGAPVLVRPPSSIYSFLAPASALAAAPVPAQHVAPMLIMISTTRQTQQELGARAFIRVELAG